MELEFYPEGLRHIVDKINKDLAKIAEKHSTKERPIQPKDLMVSSWSGSEYTFWVSDKVEDLQIREEVLDVLERHLSPLGWSRGSRKQ